MGNCNCSNKYYDPCNPCSTEVCGCSTQLSALCVVYQGSTLPILGVNEGERLESILQKIDDYLSQVSDWLLGGFSGINVGGGVEIYKGININEQGEFKTFVDSDTILVTDDTDTISFQVNETWFNNLLDTTFASLSLDLDGSILELSVGGSTLLTSVDLSGLGGTQTETNLPLDSSYTLGATVVPDTANQSDFNAAVESVIGTGGDQTEGNLPLDNAYLVGTTVVPDTANQEDLNAVLVTEINNVGASQTESDLPLDNSYVWGTTTVPDTANQSDFNVAVAASLNTVGGSQTETTLPLDNTYIIGTTTVSDTSNQDDLNDALVDAINNLPGDNDWDVNANGTGLESAPASNNVASGQYSVAATTLAQATGEASMALGHTSVASGRFSTSLGANSTAGADFSAVLGYSSITNAESAIAIGTSNEASGVGSVALGLGCTTQGEHSVALCSGTLASGLASLATGYQCEATGVYSSAMGNNTIASGEGSISIGSSSVASGLGSVCLGTNTSTTSVIGVAIGNQVKSVSMNSTSLGSWNVGLGVDTTTWVGTDPILEIGNGTGLGSESNAMTILKDGKIGIGTLVPNNVLHLSAISDPLRVEGVEQDDALTKLMVLDDDGVVHHRDVSTVGGSDSDWDINANGTGLESGTGGSNVASGDYSIAVGTGTTASGDGSFAFGSNTQASGIQSLAGVSGSVASGTNSIALGTNVTSSSIRSIGLGTNVTSSGGETIAIGANTIASTNGAIAVGRYAFATHDYSMVLAQSFAANPGNSTLPYQLTLKFFNGGRFFTSTNETTGVYLPPSGGSWVTVSDPLVKNNIVNIDDADALDLVNNVSVFKYKYKAAVERELKDKGNKSLREKFVAPTVLGVSATDVNREIVNLGLTPVHSTIESSVGGKSKLDALEGGNQTSIMWAAIRALTKKNEELEQRVLALENEN